ncbi:MAG TPA: endospore germination permease, partial [Clostridia bacterium]
TTAEIGGTAGWMIPIYSSVLVFIIFMLISKLYKGFEGKDLIDLGEVVGGSPVRIIVGLVLLVYFIFAASILLREFGEDMKVIALQISPISFVVLFFIAGIIFGNYLGLEAIVRFHALAIPVIIAAFVIIALGVAPYYDITNLLPIMGPGASNLLMKGFYSISSFSSIITVFMLFPYIKTHSNFKRVGFWSIGIGFIFLTASTLVYLMVYGFPAATENFLPIFQLARLINYGRFFQRIESIFVLAWATSAFMYLSFAFFLGIHSFRKAFRLEFYKPLIIPFAILVFTLSLVPQNLMEAINLEVSIFRNVAWIVTFVLTIILLIAAHMVKRIRNRKGAHA